MKYRDLSIQTQREFPNNARFAGFGWLVRAGYLTRDNQLLPLGRQAVLQLKKLSENPSFITDLSLPVMRNEHEIFFSISSGPLEIAHCNLCEYTARLEAARFRKLPPPPEDELPLEKIMTPECNTIEALADYLGIRKENAAKALMFTRLSDGTFIFIVVRGDMQLSEAKLKNLVGDCRIATVEEIAAAGAVPGYASPIGLENAIIIVDELIPLSKNLVAGANEAGYHLRNTNTPRDYTAKESADLTQARDGDPCPQCEGTLGVSSAISLADNSVFDFDNLLLALAETHHDEKGLTLPRSISPFDVYLMDLTGKTIDTRAKAFEIYNSLQDAGISVLFDDRDERAGVKFNDADLIGPPMRITVGEKALQDGMVELKPRQARENQLVPVNRVIEMISHS